MTVTYLVSFILYHTLLMEIHKKVLIYRGSYMSAYALLNLLYELRKNIRYKA